jgi:hypothetical protein
LTPRWHHGSCLGNHVHQDFDAALLTEFLQHVVGILAALRIGHIPTAIAWRAWCVFGAVYVMQAGQSDIADTRNIEAEVFEDALQ